MTFLVFVALPHAGFTQEAAPKAGDVVEFRMHRETLRGKVLDVNRNGWPTIEYSFRDSKRSHPMPPSRLTVVSVAEPVRTWTDKSGQFKIDGTFLLEQNGLVEIERTDGVVVEIESQLLSPTDLKYLEDREVRIASEELDKPKIIDLSKIESSIEPDLTSGRITPKFDQWNVELDPVVRATNEETGSYVLDYQPNGVNSALLKLGRPVFSSGNRFATISVENRMKDTFGVWVNDLQTGESLVDVPFYGDRMKVLCLSSDGTRLVVNSDSIRDKYIVLLSLKHEPNILRSWTVSVRNNFAPKEAHFLDNNRLVTVGNNVALWDVEQNSAIYSVRLNANAKWQFSHQRKSLAVCENQQVRILNVENGSLAGQFEVPFRAGILAFSGTGRYLAGLDDQSNQIWVWDLVDNRLVQRFGVASNRSRSMIWCNTDDYLLVDDQSLIDVELGAVVWNYFLPGKSYLFESDGRVWLGVENKIREFEISYQDLLKQTAAINPLDLTVLAPGTKVALKLKLDFNASDIRKIKERMVEAVERNGWILSEEADVVVKLTTKEKPAYTTEISEIGVMMFSKQHKVTIVPTTAAVEIQYKGKPIWSKSKTYGTGNAFRLKQGESYQEMVDRMSQPSPSFFMSGDLPNHFNVLPEGKPLGSSRIRF